MVEDEVGIEATALEVCLEVQMFGSGASGASCQSYHLTGFHLIAHLHEVLEVGDVRCEQIIQDGFRTHRRATPKIRRKGPVGWFS